MAPTVAGEVRVGPGVARELPGGGSLTGTFEFEENGRKLRVDWDARESGTVLPVRADVWDAPAGQPIAPDSRERLFESLWALARTRGIHVVLDESPSLPCRVARGWDRTTGFLVNVHDGGKLEYLEVGRTLALGYREPVDYHAVVDLPQAPRWTYPPGAPIGADEWRSVLQRLARCSPSDMWIGSNKPWRIEIPGRSA